MDDQSARVLLSLIGEVSLAPRREVTKRAGRRASGELFAAPWGARPDSGMCVLASGSAGNCGAVWIGENESEDAEAIWAGAPVRERLVLIDLGLSPGVTRKRLHAQGLSLDLVGSVLLTHLDRDHCHEGWCGERSLLPAGCEVFVPQRSRDRARAMNLNAGVFHAFESAFRTRAGLEAVPIMLSHDQHGAAAFRLTLARERAWARRRNLGNAGTGIGYATDLGRATPELIAHLRRVAILAIESNYCPTLQSVSDRPEFLKRRIMGGRGHLSNQECVEAIHAIEPRDHVVLLHLSRECNCPLLVASLHDGADYAMTISAQEKATRWVRLVPPALPASDSTLHPPRTHNLPHHTTGPSIAPTC